MTLKQKRLALAATAVLVFAACGFLLRQRPVAAPFTNGVLSPDGQLVATTTFDLKKGTNTVTVWQLSGKMVTSATQYDLLMNPSWASDSQTLFFGRVDKTYDKFKHVDDDDICSMKIEGVPVLQNVVRKPGNYLSHPMASADGVHLTYEQTVVGGDTRIIWVRDIKTQQERSLTPYRLSSLSGARWSGDGTTLAFNGTQNPSQEHQPPYLNDEENPAVQSGLVWATAKDAFMPHFVQTKFSYCEPNETGSQFALVGGKDKEAKRHIIQVVNADGTETAKLKRQSIGTTIAWNSTNTAIFFLDNFYSNKHLQLCRWDIKSGKVDVLQQLSQLRGLIMGYHSGTLFYSTAGLKEEKTSQINQLKID